MRYFEVNFSISATEDLMQDARDLLAALAGEAGFETFEETDNGLKGYVQTEMFDEEALKDAIAEFPFENVSVTYEVAEAEYRDWNEQWEQEGFEPIMVDNRCIIHDGRHLPESRSEGAIEVEIDAKLAFGTGTHETTRMIVAQLLDMQMDGKTVLDCGCGTGILGIVALLSGAERAVGYDIDEWSADNARHNAIINRVDDRYTVLLGDAAVLQSVEEKFDVVVANINRNILLNDMEIFVGKMKEGAALILSGFYESDVNILNDKALSLGLNLIKKSTDNEWTMLAFTLRHQW
ncbi:MAG: 50S ribosomal protein L11 methyltransferase [Prevotella sp.]